VTAFVEISFTSGKG